MTYTMFVIESESDEEDEEGTRYAHILAEEEYEDTDLDDFSSGGQFDEPEPWCPRDQIFFSFI
jgi:hypothetical protein